MSSPAAFPYRACADGLCRFGLLRARSALAGVLGWAASFCMASLLLLGALQAPAARGQFPIRQFPERWTGPQPVNAGAAPAEPAAGQPAAGQPALGQPALGQPALGQPALGQAPHPAVARITVPEKDGVSYGSGTLIDVRGKFGLVVTNWHVVRDAAGPISVEFPEAHKVQAEVVRTDKDWDLAALSILRPRAEPLPITTQAPQIGEWLSIAGYGGGQFRSASGFVRAYNSPSIDLPQEFIELSAEARHGDSGGPIINQRGEVCGVLFGSAPGYTCGAYGGRVRDFLATVIPGGEPGSDTAAQTAAITPPGVPAASPTGVAAAITQIVRTEMGPPRNYVPPQPETTALHQSPPAAPYIARLVEKDESSALTPAQIPAAGGPVADQEQELANDKVAIDDRLAANQPSRVHAAVPPRIADTNQPATDVNQAPADQLLAAAWQRFGGTTFFDQAKSVLAIFGSLAVAVQLWRFTSRREANDE